MAQNIITKSDSFVLFMIMIATQLLTYRSRIPDMKRSKIRIKTLFAVLIYGVIFEPIDEMLGSYYLFLLSLAVGGFLYNRFVIKSDLHENILIIIAYIYSVICLKSICLSSAAYVIGNTALSNQLLISFLTYGFQDFCLIIVSLFFIMHPLAASDYLPSKLWLVMYVGPAVLALMIQFHLDQNTANGYIFNSDFIYMNLIALVLELILYYIAHIFTKAFLDYHNVSLMNQKLSMETAYMKQSKEVAERIREEKHELKNQYFYLQALARSGKYDELESFLSSEIVERFNILEEYHTGNSMLDYLLTQKAAEARANGIKVVTSISLPQNLTVSEEDLYTLIGNLLNNAIEAEKKESDPVIMIEMSVEKNFLNISIQNRTVENILLSNPSLKTGKKNAAYHGIGLQMVKRVCDKHSGSMNISWEDGFFQVYCILMM